jgi:predicted Fe-Mo cluster-binding NifX family protein
MKIAIPVIDKELHRNRIAVSLSVIGYVCIFDTETGEGRWMKTHDLAPGMGELLSALEMENISTIISRQVQPMALKVLVNQGFRVYKSIGDRLDENIELLIKEELTTFNMEAVMANAAICGGTCEICSTGCEEEKLVNKLIG